MSTNVDLGPVLPIHKGEWSAGFAYRRNNLVTHNEGLWWCDVGEKESLTGAEPGTDSRWKLAARGLNPAIAQETEAAAAEASRQATTASDKASEAMAAMTAAQSAAGDAQTQASSARTYSQQAQTAAGNASTHASNASSSARTAETFAQQASAQVEEAGQKVVEAIAQVEEAADQAEFARQFAMEAIEAKENVERIVEDLPGNVHNWIEDELGSIEPLDVYLTARGE